MKYNKPLAVSDKMSYPDEDSDEEILYSITFTHRFINTDLFTETPDKDNNDFCDVTFKVEKHKYLFNNSEYIYIDADSSYSINGSKKNIDNVNPLYIFNKDEEVNSIIVGASPVAHSIIDMLKMSDSEISSHHIGRGTPQEYRASLYRMLTDISD